jgi:PHD/YefM family antitoxin component YafN of YafNO toxin-antitoxin module
VRIYGKNKNLWAADFEQKVNDMIDAVKELGVPNYLTKSSCEKTVIIRVDEFSASSSTNKDYITLPPSMTNLDSARDYLSILHELITFYYVQEVQYSTNNYLWYEGIPEVLSRQAFRKLNINDDGTILPLFKTTLSTAEQTNFMNYFQTPFDHRNIGYYLISYLEKTYGNDIISKIRDAEAIANIPVKNAYGAYRDKERDLKFCNCIKAVTSEHVLKDFIQYYNALK